MKTITTRWSVNILLCGVLVLFSAGSAFSEAPKGRPHSNADAANGDSQQPDDAQPVEKPDPFAVPEGTPDELFSYIDGLLSSQPEAYDHASILAFRTNTARAVLEAAEKILAAGTERSLVAADAQLARATRYKITALGILGRLGDAAAQKKLERLPAELEKAGLADLARDATAFLLQTRLEAAVRSDLKQFEHVLNDLKKFLSEAPLTRREAGLAMMAASMAEMTGKEKLVAECYRELGTILSASDDELIAGSGAMMVGTARRLTLVGKKMKIEGVTLDGTPFVWSDYAGKVVLVDFWATWCGPCLAEMPNIARNYDRYHARGFDVVAINLDEDRQSLEAFLAERKLPWTVLFDADSKTGSMADYYGISGIPTLILVGADGKVVSLDVRGPALDEELEKLLGPVEDKEAEVVEEAEKSG